MSCSRVWLSRYPGLAPLQPQLWGSAVGQLQRLGSRDALLAWLPERGGPGGQPGSAAALLGNLAQAAGACLTVCTKLHAWHDSLHGTHWFARHAFTLECLVRGRLYWQQPC
jgi:hypothetical protein